MIVLISPSSIHRQESGRTLSVFALPRGVFCIAMTEWVTCVIVEGDSHRVFACNPLLLSKWCSLIAACTEGAWCVPRQSSIEKTLVCGVQSGPRACAGHTRRILLPGMNKCCFPSLHAALVLHLVRTEWLQADPILTLFCRQWEDALRAAVHIRVSSSARARPR